MVPQWYSNFLEKFPESREIVELFYKKQTNQTGSHQLKLLGGESNGKKFWKIWVYLARLSSFQEILEDPEFFIEWKVPLIPIRERWHTKLV